MAPSFALGARGSSLKFALLIRARFTFSAIHWPRDFSTLIVSSLSHVSGSIETERVTTERPVLGRPAPFRFPP